MSRGRARQREQEAGEHHARPAPAHEPVRAGEGLRLVEEMGQQDSQGDRRERRLEDRHRDRPAVQRGEEAVEDAVVDQLVEQDHPREHHADADRLQELLDQGPSQVELLLGGQRPGDPHVRGVQLHPVGGVRQEEREGRIVFPRGAIEPGLVIRYSSSRARITR